MSVLLEFFDNERKYEKHDQYWLSGRQYCGRRAIAGGTTTVAGVGSAGGFAGGGREIEVTCGEGKRSRS